MFHQILQKLLLIDGFVPRLTGSLLCGALGAGLCLSAGPDADGGLLRLALELRLPRVDSSRGHLGGLGDLAAAVAFALLLFLVIGCLQRGGRANA